MEQRIRQLSGAIQVLQNTLAAQGGLRSGNMLKQVLSTCQNSMKEQASTLVTEYRWAVANALFASQTWVERLIVEANESMTPLYEASVGHMKKAVALAGVPRVEPQLLVELAEARASSVNEVTLALRSSFAERRRGLIRALPSFVGRLVAKMLGGGHT